MSTGAGISAATNIVGGELQGWAALLDKWAMQKQFQNEARLQGQYANQAGGVLYGTPPSGRVIGGTGTLNVQPNNPSLTNDLGAIGQSTPEYARGQIQQGAANRRQAYSDIANVPLGGGFSAQSHYNPGADNAYLGLVGDARARLGGYSDWALQQSINNLRNQQALNQVSSFAGGQAKNVFPLQMYAAQHANDALAAVGQAISSIGGAAGNYAQLYDSGPSTPSYSTFGSGPYPTYTPSQGYYDAYGNYIPAGANTLPTGYTPG